MRAEFPEAYTFQQSSCCLFYVNLSSDVLHFKHLTSILHENVQMCSLLYKLFHTCILCAFHSDKMIMQWFSSISSIISIIQYCRVTCLYINDFYLRVEFFFSSVVLVYLRWLRVTEYLHTCTLLISSQCGFVIFSWWYITLHLSLFIFVCLKCM